MHSIACFSNLVPGCKNDQHLYDFLTETLNSQLIFLIFFSFKMKFILRCLRHAAKGVIAADSEISFYDIKNLKKGFARLLVMAMRLKRGINPLFMSLHS